MPAWLARADTAICSALYLRRPGRCVNVLAAADFAAWLADGFRRVADAALAACLLVTPFELRCASALPAADFATAVAVELLRVRDAEVAAALPVCSDFAIKYLRTYSITEVHSRPSPATRARVRSRFSRISLAN